MAPAITTAYTAIGRENDRYACGDYTLGQIDIYTYNPTRPPKYMYSFNDGLTQNANVEAAAYAPHSSK